MPHILTGRVLFHTCRAIDVDFSERLLEVETPGEGENFYVPVRRPQRLLCSMLARADLALPSMHLLPL